MSRNQKAQQATKHQTARNRPKPHQISRLAILAGHTRVHAKQARHNVHGQHNRTEHGQPAEHVVGAFGALVHAQVDLREVVGVGAR
jgi:hypothetical protein